MIASNNGHLSTVSMLVDNGANVGLCDHVSTQSKRYKPVCLTNTCCYCRRIILRCTRPVNTGMSTLRKYLFAVERIKTASICK
jgi:hypothetical protein